VFKLYGEVISVKNTTINVWLNDGIYFKTICFRQHNLYLSITLMQHVSTYDSHHQADLRMMVFISNR